MSSNGKFGQQQRAGAPSSTRQARQPVKSRRRREMTRRRHETTARIRKARRSHVVDLKRRIPPTSTTTSTTTGGEPTSGAAGPAPAPAAGGPDNPWVDRLASLAEAYVSRVDGESLGALQRALSSGDAGGGGSADSLLTRAAAAATATATVTSGGCGGVIPDDAAAEAALRSGLRLADALASSLSGPDRTDSERLDASRVLTNLAAGESSVVISVGVGEEDDADDDVDAAIYGGATGRGMCHGWCHVIARSRALPALIGAVSWVVDSSSLPNSFPRPSAVMLCEQCCWALGNLGGDSQRTRDAARSAGALPPIVGALRLGLAAAKATSSSTCESGKNGTAAATTPALGTAGLCRNAAWAISNLVRGADTSAMPLLSPSSSIDATLLTPRDFVDVLMSPEIVEGGKKEKECGVRGGAFGGGANVAGAAIEIPDTSKVDNFVGGELPASVVTWDEVALEACWVLAFVTAREDEAVDLLCSSSSTVNLNVDGPSVTVCDALAYRLSRCIEMFSSVEANLGGGGGNYGTVLSAALDVAMRTCVPCVRAVGNIATACDGRYVSPLITSSTRQCPYIVESLAALITIGASRGVGDLVAISAEAAWAAGTLLCDAGYPMPHPSTSSCPVLVPALCSVVTSGRSKLDLKREAISSLLNAISSPPLIAASISVESAMQRQQNATSESTPIISRSNSFEDSETLPLRNEILTGITNYPDFLPSITRLILCPDMDAAYYALCLVNAIFRRLDMTTKGYIGRTLDEAGLLDALGTICDRESLSAEYGQDKWHNGASVSSRSADIAADLIDDFFEEEIAPTEESDPSPKNTNLSGHTTFSFGVGSTTVPVGGFNFGEPPSSMSTPVLIHGQEAPPSSGHGRGRGRGQTLPSWMQGHKQQQL